MVYRIYVEKQPELAFEAAACLRELCDLPEVRNLRQLRLLNRYDVEGISEDLFQRCVKLVFSEPQTDRTFFTLPQEEDCQALAVEYLPGQFDQRADSAAQCIQLISGHERPLLRTARVYLLYGSLSEAELAAVKNCLINPVECREAELGEYSSLRVQYEEPADVSVLEGFCACSDEELNFYISKYGLAMDNADLLCCRDYFRSEQRDPTLTELRVLDTYWSDHCRHTTFSTTLDEIQIEDADVQAALARYLQTREELGRTKPINLMDMATGAMRYLKHTGQLKNLDESPEINACTVRVEVDVDGKPEPWLLLFKNETHNHPTEIEPFGGAATCLGGAIRDPLSGRAYVYQAMRLTGAADPLTPLTETLPGKLPQRRITTKAAAGYSSYGNQIGLATGLVDEVYHPGYVSKRMEIGAVVGAVPAANVRREEPQPGDVVLLIGGGTGRDGCGGATGSSKSHDIHSIETCGAEVQKGNAPEERKLQRLFRNPHASLMIKRCNDFGAGGVSVAIGELAAGLEISLDEVPKKYEGLDGTELAISESQERMAVVVAASDAEAFIQLAAEENLLATQVAVVTEERRLLMKWRGAVVANLSRDFLDTNGAEKHARVYIPAVEKAQPAAIPEDFAAAYRTLAGDLNVCSKRGLVERFDSTIGANTVLMPFGGKHQLTPTQVMAAKLPVLQGETNSCSVMSWGFDPYASSHSPFHGSYMAVVSSVAKLLAAGAPLDKTYLSFQEYFPKLGGSPERWGLPTAALLGAFAAQLDLGLAAIGGKDSMSGSFEQLDVPPTLVSFAISMADARQLVSGEFKQAGSRVVWLAPQLLQNGLPDKHSMLQVFAQISELIAQNLVHAAYVPGPGGIAAAVLKMGLGNGLGCRFTTGLDKQLLFADNAFGFVVELDSQAPQIGLLLGETTEQALLSLDAEQIALDELLPIYEGKLERVFPLHPLQDTQDAESVPCLSSPAGKWLRARSSIAQPRFLLPVSPGTNCEYDTARAIERAGGIAEVFIINNMSPAAVGDSVRRFADAIGRAQAIMIPGGFSGGDEPDGSGKFITAFFRNPLISDAVAELLQKRDGLMCGICNGFQALIKLGLVPFGEIRDMDVDCPTLSFNTIGRHQSKLARTRIASNSSPWLSRTEVGEVYTVPVSHGEGRFLCNDQLLNQLITNGQIATQYVGLDGLPSMDCEVNINGSVLAVEGITSPDGRIFGKMGHSERISQHVYRNVPGKYDMQLFESAVDFFRG